jgi:hypothetical protein
VIIWTGAGILVAVVGVFGWAIGYAVGGDQYGMIGGGVGLIIAAVGLWFLGRRLNDPQNARVLVDPRTGQQVVLHRTHTLFWIKMEWWAVIFAFPGVAYIIFSLVSGERHFSGG